MGRKLLLATATLVIVTACGGAIPTGTSTVPPVSTQPSTQPPATQPPATNPPATNPPTTQPQAETTVAVDHLFFVQDSGGNKVRQGPFLISVYRPLGQVTPKALVEALVAGPTAAEESAGISSAIPAVTVRSVTVTDGVATVDLDPAFGQGGGSLLMTSRLAQLVYSLTGAEGIDGVRLQLGGQDISVFSGEGIILGDPMVRSDYEMLLPGILVESPGWGADVARSFKVTGSAAAFEATFLWSLAAGGSEIIPMTVAMTDNGGGWGHFEIDIDVPSSASGDIDLRVWEASAEDGSDQSVRTVPYRVSG